MNSLNQLPYDDSVWTTTLSGSWIDDGSGSSWSAISSAFAGAISIGSVDSLSAQIYGN